MSSSSSSLPEEIIWNILTWLPVKSLLRFRSVCKTWCDLLTSDSNFAKMHLNHAVLSSNKFISVMFGSLIDEEGYIQSIDCDSLSSSSDDEGIEMTTYPFDSDENYLIQYIGSCNGLLCILIDTTVIYIWNPSTQEYKQVPPPPPPIGNPPPTECSRNHIIEYGFGYDCKIDDYKLIIFRSSGVQDGSDYCVYTLGSNSWKRSQYIHYKFGDRLVRGVLTNRALHWIQKETTSFTVSFDISDERFQDIPLPKGLGDIHSLNLSLGVLGDSLCVVGNYDRLRFDLWVMKDYGVIESWTKLFTIAQQNAIYYDFRPLQVLENGEILFEALTLDENDHYYEVLVSYEPKHQRATTFVERGLPKKLFESETYVGSLVSLNSGTFLGKRGSIRQKRNKEA